MEGGCASRGRGRRCRRKREIIVEGVKCFFLIGKRGKWISHQLISLSSGESTSQIETPEYLIFPQSLTWFFTLIDF